MSLNLITENAVSSIRVDVHALMSLRSTNIIQRNVLHQNEKKKKKEIIYWHVINKREERKKKYFDNNSKENLI